MIMKQIFKTVVFFVAVLFAGYYTKAQPIPQTRSVTSNLRNTNAVQSMKSLDAGIYFIKINNTGKYLGVEGVSKDNGARVVEWDFANQDNHKFYIERRPDGFYTIKAVHSDRFLNISEQATNDGAPVIQWDYVEQDNLFWNLVYSTSLNGWIIRSKQSGKDIKLNGSTQNNANGIAIELNGNSEAGAQAYTFEPASTETSTGATNINRPLAEKRESKILMAANSVVIILPGGGKITRYIDPKMRMVAETKDKKSVPQLVNSDGLCNTFTAKVSSVVKEDVMTISNGNLIENFAPGLIYDVKALFNGDILNKEKFPYAQNRNPIQLITSVKNFDGLSNKIDESISKPDKTSINQAIANFYQRHTTQAERTSIQNARFYSCAITSTAEFGLKVGASGHYLFFGAKAGFEMNNSQQYKSLYFEATKELFTISARPSTEAGFFTTPPGDVSNLGDISSVTYGVRIIGKVDVENKNESMKGSLKASFEMGIAGAKVDLNTYTTANNSKSVVTLYAVGGQNDKIGVCTVENIQSTIDSYLKSANYQVAQPIKLQFSAMNGQLIRFMDATDNFTYTECTPAALLQESEQVTVDNLSIISDNPNNNDYDFYGKIWEMAYDKNGQEVPAQCGANMLMDVSGEQEIDLDDPALKVFNPGTTVKYNFLNGSSNGAYLDVYFALFDQDGDTDWGTGDDDQFSFRNSDKDKVCELGQTSRRLCRRRIYLNDHLYGGGIGDMLWNINDQTGVSVKYFLTRLKLQLIPLKMQFVVW